jgi:transposase-like protein
MQFRDEAKQAIHDRGLRVDFVAGKIGVHKATLSRWLNGHGTLGKSAQAALKLFLGLTEEATG